MSSSATSSMRLAVSFGASFLGFPTHLGYLRGLLDGGFKPEAVAGSSSGAILAGLYAAGLSMEAMEETFTRRDLKRHFREKTFPLRALGMFLARPGVPAVLLGTQIRRLLAELVGEMQIEECPVAKLHIAVVNLRTSQVELRNRGPLAETLMASCALPGFLAPRRIDGELLWDGGLGSVVPVEQWIDDPEITHIATHAILHEEQTLTRQAPERFTFAGAMLAGHQLTGDELLRWKLELARRMGKKITSQESRTMRPRLGIPLSWAAPKPWPAHARDLMAAGEASAKIAVEELRQSLVPDSRSTDKSPQALS